MNKINCPVCQCPISIKNKENTYSRCDGKYEKVSHYFTHYQSHDYLFYIKYSNKDFISFYSFVDVSNPKGYTSLEYRASGIDSRNDFEQFVPVAKSMAFIARIMKLKAFL